MNSNTNNGEWKGYTLNELQVCRLVNLTRIELEKTKLQHMSAGITDKAQALKSKPILAKMAGALDMFDYAVIAYNLGSKVYKLFRHKKNR